jgi:uncharacterized membrane protein
MKRRLLIGLIVLAVLVLALAGLVVHLAAAAARSMAGRQTRPAWLRDGAAPASLPSRTR